MKIQINTQVSSSTFLRVIPFLEKEEISFSALNGVSVNVKSPIFSGKKDSFYVLEAEKEMVLLVGLGKEPEYKSIENSFRKVLHKHDHLIDQSILLEFPEGFDDNYLEPALVGLFLGDYHLDFFKKERKNNFEELEVHIKLAHKNAEKLVQRAEKISKAKKEAFRLVDLPPNNLTPEYLAEWAVEMAGKYSLKSEIISGIDAKDKGLEAFLAVGRGSAKEPKFIILEYRHPEAKTHLGLVGKGVTFDTGGLNIKTQGMHHMKSDMGGAAAVLGATQVIADLKIPINLTTIVPAVENAVDKDAYLPSEIIASHAGLSIEVVDTDAEGRLILADGLSYLIETYKPDQVIDMATLTGSAVGTFGYECAALFSNDSKLSESLQNAGKGVGEKSWPLPIWEEYAKEMDSEIADIRNYHGKPIAGAITAAKFLQAFTHEHPSWAHLDIAGVAFADTDFAKTKSGTAFGVGLLLKFIENQL
ncbi:leucyl aminopeptidase family protein [Algoriphagus sp. NBT04N3]|jgi:leucyl aminopeptidase|uniref:leucyl aminopeptidase family protein n=1 Tax=Algoriphagus sp. NBT04N3 TaxID=2705473 RepID=UPI001C6306AE|nr:leucyl aminopeptidase family protein [Algoriphagus sp. NBT04N3]QYH38804.1 leucyl aminopeptidase family protein [Algoriphagus sp. NBT04N3]